MERWYGAQASCVGGLGTVVKIVPHTAESATQNSRSVHQVRIGTQPWGRRATALVSQKEDANTEMNMRAWRSRGPCAALLPV